MNPVSAAAVLAIVATLALAWWRKVPMVFALAIANFIVFGLTLLTSRNLNFATSPLLDDLAGRVSYLTDHDWGRLYTILTSAFLHAGLSHILGNMLVLVLLGLPFEERVGRARFLVIYLLSAVVAVLLHSVWIVETDPAGLTVPLVGASGAVFGILGAFATMYPRDQVPLFLLFIVLPRVPVFLAAIVMTGLEALFLFGSAASGVARAAHLGGAVGGLVFGLLLRPRERAAHRSGAPGIDYARLERLAETPAQRAMVDRIRENEDHPEAQRAWIERLAPQLRCPHCGSSLNAASRGRLSCPNGHEERYAR